jgi:uncharacterized protein (TIGR02391 family)
MDPEKAIDLLIKQRDELENFKAKEPWSTEYKKWRYFTERLITQVWGDDSPQLKRFTAIFQPWPIAISAGTPRGYLDEQSQRRFLNATSEASAIIDGFIDEIRMFGPAVKRPKQRPGLDPIAVFESLNLHPEIRNVVGELFADAHYGQAIFEAYKALNKYVQKKSGMKELDGSSLMSMVFSRDKPILALNSLKGISDKDEQQGFMLLYMGAMLGIRNPNAHEIIQQSDPHRTLEYLALASLLMNRVDEARKLKRNGEVQKKLKATGTTQRVGSRAAQESAQGYDQEQLEYRSLLKEEIIRLRQELDNFENPGTVPFPIWLCSNDFTKRRKLIGNDREHEIIQNFYTALQNRYDHQTRMNRPDGKFSELNAKCLEAYDMISKEARLVHAGPHSMEQLKVYAQLSEIISNISDEAPRPGGQSISISGSIYEQIKTIIEENRYLVEDSTATAWRKVQVGIIAHTGESVFDLQLFKTIQADVRNHHQFLKMQLSLY